MIKVHACLLPNEIFLPPSLEDWNPTIFQYPEGSKHMKFTASPGRYTGKSGLKERDATAGAGALWEVGGGEGGKKYP